MEYSSALMLDNPTSPNDQPLSPSSHHRRHSSRSIKRRKFDDELVESSLIAKTSRRSSDGVLSSQLNEEFDANSSQSDGLEHEPSQVHHIEKKIDHSILNNSASVTKITPLYMTNAGIKKSHIERKMSSAKKKRMKKTRQAFAAVKDMGRWKPTDDISLIDAVERLGDLTSVHVAVKFSCFFTIEEVQERWYALLYDPVISGLARQAMKSLPPEAIQETKAKALFDKHEEEVLFHIGASSNPSERDFQMLLREHTDIFHQSRTPTTLMKYWKFLREYHLLPQQSVTTLPVPSGDHILQLSDAEDLLEDEDLKTPKDEVLNAEILFANKHQMQEVRKLESVVQTWQTIVENVTGNSLNVLDSQTIAVLRGRVVRYLMRSKEITFGRSTDDWTVDVDMALEGPAFKVSRRHGCIKMKGNGDFVLYNEGKRPIFVDGKPVLSGTKNKLLNNAVVEIGLLRFVFLINEDYIKSLGKKRNP